MINSTELLSTESFPDLFGAEELLFPKQAEKLREILKNISFRDFKKRQQVLDLAAEQAGLIVPGDSERSLPVDLLPHIIPHKEWKLLSAAIIQRLQAFNLFVKDIYSAQNILKTGLIPHELVLSDPTYMRELRHFPIRQKYPITMGALDLVRNSETGKWEVLEHHFAIPTGASNTLLNRRLLRQNFPEIFAAALIEPVAPFSTQLLETLRKLSDQPNPHVVLLHESQDSLRHSPSGFLARRMGLAIVEPADLIVRNSQVFLKTVGGLEKVDVIYRRIRSTWIDPVAFGATTIYGIPGMMSCVRKGSVVIANALGSGIADNKALLPYVETIIRYYLNEDSLLPSVATYPSTASVSGLQLKPIQSFISIQTYCESIAQGNAPTNINDLHQAYPHLVVGQSENVRSSLARWSDRGIKKYPTMLRIIALMGETPYVLPGGLTTQRLNTKSFDYDATKDTWVLSNPTARKPRTESLAVTPLTKRSYRMPSRAAESLYWMGRYAERIENTARMLHVLERSPWEELQPTSQKNYWPFWRAVATATEQTSYATLSTPPKNTTELTTRLLISKNDPASVMSCLAQVRHNAQMVRDFVVPEVIDCIEQFYHRADRMAHAPGPVHHDFELFCKVAIDQIALLNGTAERSMPHDDGWYFFKVGTALERSFGTLSISEHVFKYCIHAQSNNTPEESPDLTTLLRLVGSLDAYRRNYQSRVYIERVAELLWQNETTPSSLAFCAKVLNMYIHAITTITPYAEEITPFVRLEQQIKTLRKHLSHIHCAHLFPQHMLENGHGHKKQAAQPSRLIRTFELLQKELEGLHQTIEDAFFSHQMAPEEQEPPMMFSI